MHPLYEAMELLNVIGVILVYVATLFAGIALLACTLFIIRIVLELITAPLLKWLGMENFVKMHYWLFMKTSEEQPPSTNSQCGMHYSSVVGCSREDGDCSKCLGGS